jgi:hypothetical protein
MPYPKETSMPRPYLASVHYSKRVRVPLWPSNPVLPQQVPGLIFGNSYHPIISDARPLVLSRNHLFIFSGVAEKEGQKMKKNYDYSGEWVSQLPNLGTKMFL